MTHHDALADDDGRRLLVHERPRQPKDGPLVPPEPLYGLPDGFLRRRDAAGTRAPGRLVRGSYGGGRSCRGPVALPRRDARVGAPEAARALIAERADPLLLDGGRSAVYLAIERVPDEQAEPTEHNRRARTVQALLECPRARGEAAQCPDILVALADRGLAAALSDLLALRANPNAPARGTPGLHALPAAAARGAHSTRASTESTASAAVPAARSLCRARAVTCSSTV